MPKTKPLFVFTAKLFSYSVEATSWFFVETNATVAAEMKSQARSVKAFGSIPVQVTVGQTTWRTSLFPTKQKTYVLPIKAIVRRKEDIREGDRIKIMLELI
ncbi:MAG: DUF1905 domain-containing protein [Candidatus Moraniibacteriota bacterium]|nr:MAG: DUF1905 domain-containing protein [Candidatus Moranbacteria bacterium]